MTTHTLYATILHDLTCTFKLFLASFYLLEPHTARQSQPPPHHARAQRPGGDILTVRGTVPTAEGTYTLTDVDAVPWNSGEPRGMVLHPGLPILYVGCLFNAPLLAYC